MTDELDNNVSAGMLDPSRRLDGLNDNDTIPEEEVESARWSQVVIEIGALSNNSLNRSANSVAFIENLNLLALRARPVNSGVRLLSIPGLIMSIYDPEFIARYFD